MGEGGGGGVEGAPTLLRFFLKPPIKPNALHGAHPPLKNEVSPIWKTNPPHWNVKHATMKWFLEKAQQIIT